MHKTVLTAVNKWRSDHADWKELAAFLLSKHSGRRMRKRVPGLSKISQSYNKDIKKNDDSEVLNDSETDFNAPVQFSNVKQISRVSRNEKRNCNFLNVNRNEILLQRLDVATLAQEGKEILIDDMKPEISAMPNEIIMKKEITFDSFFLSGSSQELQMSNDEILKQTEVKESERKFKSLKNLAR